MATRPWRGPSEAVPAHAQRGVPARDTRWRQRHWGGRGGGGKTGGRAERVAASPRVRSGQVRAPGSHGLAASRARVRESEAGRRWLLWRFPLEGVAGPVSFVAAILGPRWAAGPVAGVKEVGPESAGGAASRVPPLLPPPPPLCRAPTLSRLRPGAGARGRAGGGAREMGRRARAQQPAPAGVGVRGRCTRTGNPPSRALAPAHVANPVAPPYWVEEF